jgi:hypothetical protein
MTADQANNPADLEQVVSPIDLCCHVRLVRPDDAC